MTLRGTVIRWKWFVKEVVVLFPVILLILSACATKSTPGSSPAESPGGFRYNHRLFSMELKNVEVFDDEVKVTLMYTNRGDRPAYGGVTRYRDEPYLVDNLGRRYRYATSSFGGGRSDFPPQIQEEIWITFAKVQSGAASVNLVMPWHFRGSAATGVETVTFRRIALPQATSAQAQGSRYDHRAFTMELSRVEVVGEEVKVTLMYTNRAGGAQPAGITRYSNEPYLVDNLGKRYRYIANSFGGTRSNFPQTAEEIWISFGKFQPGASSVNLILPWHAGGGAAVTVTFRDIPLRQ